MLMEKGGAVDEYLTCVRNKSQARILEARIGRMDWEKHEELVKEHAMLAERVAEIGANIREAMTTQIKAEEFSYASENTVERGKNEI